MLDKLIQFPHYLILSVRHALYDSGICKSVKADVPTICLGNVTVGGTGKTPHTEMLLRLLSETDEWGGKNLAVLSRGYKRRSCGFLPVSYSGNASEFGDEPLQIKKKFPQITVAVDANRVRGCSFLAHPEKTAEIRRKYHSDSFPPASLILLDDAFQYRRLKADMNIVLVDYNRPVFSDSLIPFGRLRDLPSRIYKADMIIVTKCPALYDEEKIEFVGKLGLSGYNVNSCEAVTPKGMKISVFFTEVRYCDGLPVYGVNNPRFLYSKKTIMFTGIADDSPLCAHLSDSYKIVEHFRFPDHHRFSSADIARISRAVKACPTAAVVTTEKDAQRLLDCTAIPETIKERLFAIPITVDFLSDGERETFLNKLKEL